MEENKKKKKSVFWIIYGIITSVSVIAAVTVLIVLWDFLGAYEVSQPEHIVDSVIEKIANKDETYINEYIGKRITEFEVTNVSKIADELLSGEWTYSKKSSEYKADAPVYNLKKDGENKGVLRIKKSEERGSYNTPKWIVEDITFVMDTKEYVITIPSDAKLAVNGVEVAESYVTGSNIECEALTNAKEYLNSIPTMKKYTITGFVYEPEINATGVYGGELQVAKKEDVKNEDGKRYTDIAFHFDNNASLIASQEERILAATKTYGYFANNAKSFSELATYTMTGSYAYNYMKRIADNNIWSTGRTQGTFENVDILNERVYSEDCFSCEVKFTYKVKTIIKWEEFDTHVYYVFVKKGDKYYMVDFAFMNE